MMYSVLVVVMAAHLVNAQDKGFELLWESSMYEAENVSLITKDVPKWIKGVLLRNGPGRFEIGPHSVNHYFDGFAKLARFEFNKGGVRFTTKFLQTDFYRDSVEINDIARYLTLGHIVPEIDFLRKLDGFLHGIHNMGVNIVPLFDGKSERFYALNDVWRMYEIHPTNLNTIGVVTPAVNSKYLYHQDKQLERVQFGSSRPDDKALSGFFETDSAKMSLDPRLSSAHPMKEHGRHSWITFYTKWSPIGKTRVFVYRVHTLSAHAEPEVVAVLKLDRLHYMHSFGMTTRHAIFTANSCYVDMVKAVTSVPFDGIMCDNEQPATVFVVNLKNGDVKQFQTDPMFVMHHINAYEVDNSTIVADMTDHKDFSLVRNLTRDILLNRTKRNSQLHPTSKYIRLVIHLDTNKIELKHFDTKPEYSFLATSEFPVINEMKRFSKYCYVYGVTFTSYENNFANISLTKKDVCGGGGDNFWQINNHYPSEPRFLPRPGGVNEDDGVILSVVLDGEKRLSYCAVIDAKTMRLISTVYIPTTIPFGLHGNFFDFL